MDPKIKRMIDMINSKKKLSHPWRRQERYDQSYYTFSPDKSTWEAVSPSRSGSPASLIPKISIMSWNIDFMLPFTDERMLAALKHLESHVQANSTPTIVMLQEMLETDLALIQEQPWIREKYSLTDITSKYWESGHYGTCTLIPTVLPVNAVFRVHYEQTVMERDALFVDLAFGNGHSIRICNSHLESLIADPPKRPQQLATAAKVMRDPAVTGSVIGGDFNAIQDFDRTLHTDNGLQDAYLTMGGSEDSDEGYTWGQMAPTKQRDQFGCSRMDKLFFCGNLRCEKFERFGLGVKAEEKHVQDSLIKEEGMEEGWVTDHLGVKAEFSIPNSRKTLENM
ncbi:Endonuclease/exonuclease/phosphatase [Exophiala viscosa]|uniref:Endonuclease/exonuclease/phosphatase n=1 Tax=Exophiala viscosa TaxID=2486360 RepID=A0AAN6IKF3_9EURO|nr:Endonuclease/exonuclease/phosphatase [Exophiala viscosa]KAI1627638.1 Endonuclease/exonuclease/phosphatase [Exophiala viscosa]